MASLVRLNSNGNTWVFATLVACMFVLINTEAFHNEPYHPSLKKTRPATLPQQQHPLLRLVSGERVVSPSPPRRRIRTRSIFLHAASSSNSNINRIIEFQADESKFGRGEYHLSASLDEGDVVVWQSGTWMVDGVEVGDGSPPKLHYAKIDNIQLVWTHNCEHGVIRGTDVTAEEVDNRAADRDVDCHSKQMARLYISEPLEEVEFGPEQLIARLPVIWDNEDDVKGVSTVEFDSSMWKPL